MTLASRFTVWRLCDRIALSGSVLVMSEPEVSGGASIAGVRRAALWLGPLVAALAAAVILSSGMERDAGVVTFIAVLCVVWWVFEPVPIPVTSLLPLALLPLLGVLTPAEVGSSISVVAVLDIHILRTAAATMKPSTSRLPLEAPKRRTIPRASRR